MSTILVTGSTDGIGQETALELARRGHTLVLHGRSMETVEHARARISASVPTATLHAVYADFADLPAVRQMAQELTARLPSLDVLINNAGVYMAERRISGAGFEMTLAVNYIAPFLLTLWLLPLLKRSTDPRVVTVSSIAHTRGRIDFDDMNGERHFDAYHAYANSKLADALFANELARREPWLSSNSLHPGVIDTKLLHAGFSAKGDGVTSGARTPVFLATSPDIQGISGRYFDRCIAVPCSPLAADRRLGATLWDWTESALRPYLPRRDMAGDRQTARKEGS